MKLEKLEKLEKVVPVPNTVFYGAYYYNGKDIELCDDEETEETKDEKGNIEETTHIHIQDRIIEGILIKDKELIVTPANGKKLIERVHKEIPLKENDMLIYVMYEGFVMTKTQMISIDKAIERYSLLKSPEEE